jgi:hypothetical protein
MIRNAIATVIICAIGLTIWRIWGAGGDISSFFAAIWGVFYAIVDAISSALVTAWETIFGSGG